MAFHNFCKFLWFVDDSSWTVEANLLLRRFSFVKATFNTAHSKERTTTAWIFEDSLVCGFLSRST